MVNASKQISARERARAASMQFYELEKQREAVQVRYFASMNSVDKVHQVRDREIEAAYQRAARAAASAVDEADEAIRELLGTGVTRSEVQQRLGCTSADVRRAVEGSIPSAESSAEQGSTSAESAVDVKNAVTEIADGELSGDDPAVAEPPADRGESVVSEPQGQD